MTKQTKATAAAAPAAEKPVSHREYYKAAYLDGWQPVSGPAPALVLFDAVHAMADKRPGAEALHIAMCLRPQGCTVREFMVAGNCGPANNYRKALQTVTRVITVTKLPGDGGRGYRFKAAPTAKGLKLIEAALGKVPAALVPQASDAPAKAPRKRKAKAAPTPQADAPASDAPAAPQA